MTDRPSAIHKVLETARAAVLRHTAFEPAGRLAARLSDALPQVATAQGTGSEPLPACRHLDAALGTARSGPAAVAALADAVAAVRPQLNWYRRVGARPDDGAFFDKHANAQLVGPGAAAPETGLRIGVSLLAPGVRYPDHRHPPEEIYIALSPGEWRQEDGPWGEPGVGGLVHNPPNIIHAMRAKDVPLLAVWCLW